VREMAGWLTFFPGPRQFGLYLRSFQRDRLARRLTRELEAWLVAIKAHLEAGGASPAGGAEVEKKATRGRL